jgi:hypothetical protein
MDDNSQAVGWISTIQTPSPRPRENPGDREDGHNDLDPPAGIGHGVVLSLAFWAVIAAVIF